MNEQIKSTLEKHGLTVDSVFVPFSKSRNAGEKSPSLNWIVTLKRNGREIVKTDYMAGCGHAPSYKQSFGRNNEKIVRQECETGKKCQWSDIRGAYIVRKETVAPDAADVVYSLLMDSDVLSYANFEEWAREFGYDQDSRKAEETYKACMKIALQFNRLGESIIAKLCKAFQDY